MKKVFFVILKIFTALSVLIVLLLAASFTNHRIRLSKEEKLLQEAKAQRPLGNSFEIGLFSIDVLPR